MIARALRLFGCVCIALGPGCGATVSSLIAGPFLDEGRRLMAEVRKENTNLAAEWRSTNEAMLRNIVEEQKQTRTMSMAAWSEARAGLNAGQDGFRDGVTWGGFGIGGTTAATAGAMHMRAKRKNGANDKGGGGTPA